MYKFTDSVAHVAGNILCTNELPLEDQIIAILKVADRDEYEDYITTIDDIEGVEVSEDFEGVFTVCNFLAILPFNKENNADAPELVYYPL